MCPGISHSFLLDSSTLPSELDSTILSRLVDVHCHPIDEKGYDLNQLNLNSKLKAIVSLFSFHLLSIHSHRFSYFFVDALPSSISVS